nr:MAG TPA: hypothetical protein [Inoviridae sp.]
MYLKSSAAAKHPDSILRYKSERLPRPEVMRGLRPHTPDQGPAPGPGLNPKPLKGPRSPFGRRGNPLSCPLPGQLMGD